MKNLIKIGALLLLFGCSSNKYTNTIPYLISLDAEKSIYNKISKLENNSVMFYFEHLPNLNYKIYLVSRIGKNEFSSTNRKLFINENFYPIIFDTDYQFYSKLKEGYPTVLLEDKKEIKIPIISEREKNVDLYGYNRKNLIIDNTYYWVIDKKGKLVESNTEN